MFFPIYFSIIIKTIDKHSRMISTSEYRDDTRGCFWVWIINFTIIFLFINQHLNFEGIKFYIRIIVPNTCLVLN